MIVFIKVLQKNEKILSWKAGNWESDNICKKKQYPINIIKPYKLSGQCMCDYGLMDTAFVSVFDFKKKGGAVALVL